MTHAACLKIPLKKLRTVIAGCVTQTSRITLFKVQIALNRIEHITSACNTLFYKS